MAAINNENIKALSINFKAIFQKEFESIETDYSKIATDVKSTTAGNTYAWLGQMPNMREWIGDRVLKNFTSHDYSIKNKSWESSLAVKATDIEDDNLGIYAPLVSELAMSAARHPDELIFELLSKGEEETCYDGQSFFDAEHPVFENNDGTGKMQTVSNITDGTEKAWYLFDTSRSLKPFIHQVRKSPKLTAMTDASDESVFMRNEFRYGVDSRSNVGFGFWQLAHKSKADLNTETFSEVFAKMQNIKADGGRKLGVKPTLLVVPPSMRKIALELLESDRDFTGMSNINKGAVKLLISPWVGD